MGWERSGTYLYKVFESFVHYDKAEIRCESLGGRLIAQALRDSSVVQLVFVPAVKPVVLPFYTLRGTYANLQVVSELQIFADS